MILCEYVGILKQMLRHFGKIRFIIFVFAGVWRCIILCCGIPISMYKRYLHILYNVDENWFLRLPLLGPVYNLNLVSKKKTCTDNTNLFRLKIAISRNQKSSYNYCYLPLNCAARRFGPIGLNGQSVTEFKYSLFTFRWPPLWSRNL